MTTEWLMDAVTNMLCLLKDGNKIILYKKLFSHCSVLMIVNERVNTVKYVIEILLLKSNIGGIMLPSFCF